MERFTVSSGSATLVCEACGDGPPVVFLHAGVADRRGWYGAMRALAPRHRAVAYDRRGFGETRYEPESHAHVDDLVAVLDRLGADAPVLVGNSQGGRIAIDFVLAHPARARALMLVAPALSGADEPDEYPPAVETLGAAIDAAEAANDLDALNRLEAHLWLDGPESPEGRVGGDARVLFLSMNGRALAAPPTGDERTPPPAVDRLRELSLPALVMVGGRDLPHIRDQASAIAHAARATLSILPEVAHLPQLEEPDLFNHELERFLGTLPA